VDPTVSGPSAGLALVSGLWAEISYYVELFFWVLAIFFAFAAFVWSCGYVIRAIWLQTGQPAHRTGTARTAADDSGHAVPAAGASAGYEITNGASCAPDTSDGVLGAGR
jgi:hypothetical protein